MFQKFSKIILAIFLVFTSIAILPTVNTFAKGNSSSDDVCSLDVPQSVKDAAGCSGNGDQLPYVIINILNAIIGVAGLIAVIFIIVGGINYMTSAGETTKLEKAKKTILYATIGLVVCVLAFAIVNFAITIIYSNNATEGASFLIHNII